VDITESLSRSIPINPMLTPMLKVLPQQSKVPGHLLNLAGDAALLDGTVFQQNLEIRHLDPRQDISLAQSDS
jgi:hypothetical protein